MTTVKCIAILLALYLATVAAFPSSLSERGYSGKFTFLGRFSNAPSHLHNHRDKRSIDPSSRTALQESFYFRSQNAAGWATALSDCKAFLAPSATLLYIETQEELANITHYIKSSDDTGSLYWIGGKYDPDKSTFVWDNQVEIESWAPWEDGHPNTWTPVTRVAAATVGSVKFRTQFSTESARFICELKSGTEKIDEVKVEEEENLMNLSCSKDNDLVILLDSSGSIGEENYKIALEFSARLATAWMTNPQNRISFIVYSNDAHVIISLKDVLSTKQTRRNIYRAPYLKGRTASNIGLDQVLSEVQQSNRTDVSKNVVLLTDGVSNWPTQTITSAERIHQAGVKAYSVGIGESVLRTELLAVAGNELTHVFNADGFQELFQLLQPLSKSICEQSQS